VSGVNGARPSEPGRNTDGRYVLAASTVLLALAGAFFMVPLLFVAPVPLAVLVYRDGYRPGTVTAVLTLVLVAFAQQRLFAGLPAGVSNEALQSYSMMTMIALLTTGLIGMVIGGAWREGASWWQAFWLAFAGAVLPGVLVWTGALTFRGVDLFGVVFENWMEVVRSVIAEAERSGAGADAVRALEQAAAETEASFALLRPLLPGLIAVGALFGAFVNTALSGLLLRRAGDEPPRFPPFAGWRWPWSFALGFIVGQVLLLFAGDGSRTAVVGHNLLIVFNTLFAVQGAAVGWFWLRRGNVGTPLAAALLAVTYVWLPAVFTWIGLLDTWLDFRRRSRRGADESEMRTSGR